MSPQRREIRSAYIEWAKLRSAARYKLAGSDMLAYPLKDLPVRIEELEIANPSDSYGYSPLVERLAKKAGVPADCVVQVARLVVSASRTATNRQTQAITAI